MNDVEALTQALDDPTILSDIYWLSESSTGRPIAERLTPIVTAIIAALPEGWVLREAVPLTDILDAAEASGVEQERKRLREQFRLLDHLNEGGAPWSLAGIERAMDIPPADPELNDD